MATEIYLSAIQKNFLLVRDGISSARASAANSLSTGLRVSSINDDAGAYLKAQALLDRVGTLREVKPNIGQAISALDATQAGSQAVEHLTQQLKGIALAAKSATDAEKADFAEQFNSVRTQIDSLVNDTSYQGVNLLASPTATLSVNDSDTAGTAYDVTGQATDTTTLGIGDAASYNNFATDADIDNALAALNSAISTVRTNESTLGGHVAFLGIREQFTEDLSNTAQSDQLIIDLVSRS